MGLLDAIARNLAHISDASRNFNTFRPTIEDPTAVLEEAIERRRRQRVAVDDGFGFGDGGGPSALLDGVVLDPTIRVRYAEKASLVELDDGGGVGGAPTITVDGSVVMHGAGLRPATRGSRTSASNTNNNHPPLAVVDVKEIVATTRRANGARGGVRFVGDRQGWDQCLADMAEEQRLRDLFGDAFVDKQRAMGRAGMASSKRQRREEARRRDRLNASLQRRLASQGDAADVMSASAFGAEYAESVGGTSDEFSVPSGDDDDDGQSSSAPNRRATVAHYDSSDDDAESVYDALAHSTAYNSLAAGTTAQQRQKHQRRGKGKGRGRAGRHRHHHHGSSNFSPSSASPSPRSNEDEEDDDDGGDAYRDKVRKLRAPRLEPKVFTHVHRCVGTDDMVAMNDAAFEGGGGLNVALNRMGGAARGGGYSYRGARKGLAAQNATHAPTAIAGRRVKFIFLTFAIGMFAFTAMLWAYLSYLRYFLSGDSSFTTGGAYWRDGFPAQNVSYTSSTLDLNDVFNLTAGGAASNPNETIVVVVGPDSAGTPTTVVSSIVNDSSWVWIGDELKRVKPGGMEDLFGAPDAPLTMPMLGVAYLACVVAGLTFFLATAVYIVCYVNGVAQKGLVGTVVRMKQLSDEIRAIERASEEEERNNNAHHEAAVDVVGGRGNNGSPHNGGPAPPLSPQLQLTYMMMASMGLPIPDTMPPSWEPEIPLDRQVEFNDSLDSRVELRYGWLLPLFLYPIPLTDVLLADPRKERRKVMGFVKALFIPAWLLGLIPTVIFFLVAGDAMDSYFISYIARSMGGIDVGVVLALAGIAVFELLPVYWVYHKKAGQFVERRYG